MNPVDIESKQVFNPAISSLFSVKNKNVLITGGSRGIGLMIGRTLAAHGANIILTSRDSNACAKAAASIQKYCSSLNCHAMNSGEERDEVICAHVASNVGTREGCKKLAEYTKQVFRGRLDVLINNAGCSWGEDPYITNKQENESGKMNWGWDKVLDLNVKGLFYLTRECVPLLERNNSTSSTIASAASYIDPGRVINIGSVAGMTPMKTPTHAYDVSKAAVHHLTKKMAADLAKKNITVNAIAPGFVETRMSLGLGKWVEQANMSSESSDVDGLKDMQRHIPLGRMGTEEDMAGACIYLSSRAGAWCTGVILNVDGGTAGCLQIPLSSNL